MIPAKPILGSIFHAIGAFPRIGNETCNCQKFPASMFKSKFFEDYQTGEVRETGGRTVTETDIILHAGQTGDFYPHHMDAEWCKLQHFGQRIAHGTLIFSVAVGMTAGAVNPEAISYGYDRLRFIKPVFIADTIRVRVSVKEKRDHKNPSHGIVSELVEVLNQRNETVLACEHLLLVKKRI
jgi:acyl dehydratase